MKQFICVLSCLLPIALSGCGGGGGGDDNTISATTTSTVSNELRAEFQGLLNASDTLIMTELHEVNPRTQSNYAAFTGIRAVCRAAVCQNVHSLIPTASLSEFEVPDSLEQEFTRNNVPLGTGRSVDTAEGITVDQYTYGGWLAHSVFGFDVTNFHAGANVSADNYEGSLVGSWSIGKDTGTRPISGSATWDGAMVGVKGTTLDGVHGDASIFVDLDSAEADVAFTAVRYLDTNGSLPSMHWRDLSIDLSGRFSDGRGKSIVGSFYGPNHAEVGGVFERNNIVGAFGGSR